MINVINLFYTYMFFFWKRKNLFFEKYVFKKCVERIQKKKTGKLPTSFLKKIIIMKFSNNFLFNILFMHVYFFFEKREW